MGGKGQLLGFLQMKTKRADGQGNEDTAGYDEYNMPPKIYHLNASSYSPPLSLVRLYFDPEVKG